MSGVQVGSLAAAAKTPSATRKSRHLGKQTYTKGSRAAPLGCAPCDRLAMDGVIDAVPVMGRQAGHLGQPIEVQLFVQMIMDISGNPPQPLLIVRPAAAFLHSLPFHRMSAEDVS